MPFVPNRALGAQALDAQDCSACTHKPYAAPGDWCYMFHEQVTECFHYAVVYKPPEPVFLHSEVAADLIGDDAPMMQGELGELNGAIEIIENSKGSGAAVFDRFIKDL